MIKPKKLNKGDMVAIVSLSSGLAGEEGLRHRYELGKHRLEEEFGLFTQSIALRFDPTCVYYQFTPQVENAQKLVVDNNLCAEKSNAPIIVKSEYNEEYGSILAELQTKFLEFASKYIVGETTECDKMWSDWLAQADSIGVQRIVEIANMPKK